MNNEKNIEEKHIPVLLNELVDTINISGDKKNIIVDCTLGMGGHASKIIEKMNTGDIFVGFDADERNLIQAKTRLEEINKDKKVELIFINSNFVNLKAELKKHKIEKVTGIYYDLGISSLHIDEAERGFSFRFDGPLDMRLNNNKGKTAADIVNSYLAGDLRRIFIEYAEERYSSVIANKIVERRKKTKFKTTKELSDLIGEVSNSPKTKSRIFQALRIETNNELQNLEKSLFDAIGLLEESGIIFIISFHSLEDRIVKNIFKREYRDCICNDLICSCKHTKTLKKMMKKPIIPSANEIELNSRSRSAKARYAKKI